MDGVETTRYTVYKNLLVLSFSVCFLFTAEFPIQDLQSSIYNKNGMGYFGLNAVSIGMAISTLFFTTLFLQELGANNAMKVTIVSYMLFFAANLYGTWWTLIPTSIIKGLGGGTLWTASQAYITKMSVNYATVTGQSENVLFSKFYSIFFSIFKLSQITGNTISSTVLRFQHRNSTNISMQCGPTRCPGMMLPAEQLDYSHWQLLQLIIISIAFGCSAFILLSLFLDRQDDKKDVHDKESKMKLIFSASKEMCDYRMLLLFPISLLSGLQCGFIYAEYTKDYITCYQGVDMIGWTMSVFGICSSMSSFVFGVVSKHIGPFFILTGTFVLHILILICLLKWESFDSFRFYFFPYLIIAGLYGICDTAWRSQIPVLVPHLFSVRLNEKFSLVMTWQFLGFALYFSVGPYLCVYVKIYIIIIVMVIGLILCSVLYYRIKSKDDYKLINEENE